jgi:hypothetical protein
MLTLVSEDNNLECRYLASSNLQAHQGWKHHDNQGWISSSFVCVWLDSTFFV